MILRLVKLIIVVPLSWVLAHLTALFGVFVAVAYPAAWLIFPKSTPCLLCRIRKPGELCGFCGEKVRSEAERFPKNFKSALFNAAVIFTVSCLCIAAVAAETMLIQKFSGVFERQKVSLVLPGKSNKTVGAVFPLVINLAEISYPINLVQTDLSFDTNILKVVDVDTSDSFATIFVQRDVNNDFGFVRLVGGLPNPGYSQPQGLFAKIYFQAINPGVTEVEFLPSSLILANDGSGTNVLKDVGAVSYAILPGPEEFQPAQSSNEIELNVLGTETDLEKEINGTKLEFYLDTQVLGTSSEAAKPEEVTVPSQDGPKESLLSKVIHTFFELILTVNMFILNFWKSFLL